MCVVNLSFPQRQPIDHMGPWPTADGLSSAQSSSPRLRELKDDLRAIETGPRSQVHQSECDGDLRKKHERRSGAGIAGQPSPTTHTHVTVFPLTRDGQRTSATPAKRPLDVHTHRFTLRGNDAAKSRANSADPRNPRGQASPRKFHSDSADRAPRQCAPRLS